MSEYEIMLKIASNLDEIELSVDGGTQYEDFVTILMDEHKSIGTIDDVEALEFDRLPSGELEIYSFINDIKRATIIKKDDWQYRIKAGI